MKKRKNKFKLHKDNILVLGTVTFAIFMFFNLFLIYQVKNEVGVKKTEIEELTKIPEVNLIYILPECDVCFDLTPVISQIKNSNINITKEIELNISSEKAMNLIKKYKIEKLPTVILKGDIDRVSLQDFVKNEDALVFNNIQPPYINTKTFEISGLVSAIIIEDSKCKLCYNFDTVLNALKQSGVVFSERKKIDFNSTEGDEIIKKYEIKRVPALLLSSDIDLYSVAQNLKQSGAKAKNGYYVFETGAPYVDVNTGAIRGLVELIMLNDTSCNDCYDVRIHKQILMNMGLAIENEKIIDINSRKGKELINKYNITKVPTIILKGDLEVYDAFKQIWQQVGTIEKDGAYVFRNMQALRGAVYREIE